MLAKVVIHDPVLTPKQLLTRFLFNLLTLTNVDFGLSDQVGLLCVLSLNPISLLLFFFFVVIIFQG